MGGYEKGGGNRQGVSCHVDVTQVNNLETCDKHVGVGVEGAMRGVGVG